MQYKVFAIPVLGDAQSEADLNHFLMTHKIIQVDKELITQGGLAVWSFCVGYQTSNQAEQKSSKKPRVDYKEILTEEEFTCFAALRELRKQEAEKEGVPVFALFTNEQLAAMVQTKVVSKHQLKAIEGIGDSKINRYGSVFLDYLKHYWAKMPCPSVIDSA